MSETSWKDNVDWKQEYAENDKWSDDLKLPHRRVPVRFGRAPDYTDANFDWEHPGCMYTSKKRFKYFYDFFCARQLTDRWFLPYFFLSHRSLF
jgi:hypothetical protein